MKEIPFAIFVLGLVFSSCQSQKEENATAIENPFHKEWTTNSELFLNDLTLLKWARDVQIELLPDGSKDICISIY